MSASNYYSHLILQIRALWHQRSLQNLHSPRSTVSIPLSSSFKVCHFSSFRLRLFTLMSVRSWWLRCYFVNNCWRSFKHKLLIMWEGNRKTNHNTHVIFRGQFQLWNIVQDCFFHTPYTCITFLNLTIINSMLPNFLSNEQGTAVP